MQTRFLIWLSSLEMIRQSPLLGGGIGTYGINYPLSQGKVLEQERYQKYIPYTNKSINAHNDYLNIGAEVGIIGLAVFLWIIFVFYKNTLNGLLRIQNRERIFLLIGFMGGVTVLLVHALPSFPFQIIQNGMLFWVILGFSVVVTRNPEETGGNKNEKSLNDNTDKKFSSNKYKIFEQFKVNIFLKRSTQIGIVVAIMLFVIVKVNWYIADTHQDKGEWLMQIGNYSAAVEELEKSRELNPYSGRNYLLLGITYYNLRRYDKAVIALKKAEKNWINNVIYNYLGCVYFNMGDWEEAEKAYQKNIYMFPNLAEAYLNLGNIYMLQAEKDLAEGKINLAEKKLDKAFLIYEQGMVFDREFSLPGRLIRGYQRVAIKKVDLNSEGINGSGLLTKEDPLSSRYFYNPQDSYILDILLPWAPPDKSLSFKAFSYGVDNINNNLNVDIYLQIEDLKGNSLISLEMKNSEENIFFNRATIWSALLREGLPEGEYQVRLKVKDGEREIAETMKQFKIFEEGKISGRIIEFFVPQVKSEEVIIPKIIFRNQSTEILPVWGFFKIIDNKGQEIANIIIDRVDVLAFADKELEVSWQPEKRLLVGMYKAELIIIFEENQTNRRECLLIVVK